MSNTNVKTEKKKSAKDIFDLISLSALKVEVVVMVAVMLTCAFKATTSFIL